MREQAQEPKAQSDQRTRNDTAVTEPAFSHAGHNVHQRDVLQRTDLSADSFVKLEKKSLGGFGLARRCKSRAMSGRNMDGLNLHSLLILIPCADDVLGTPATLK